MPTLAEAMRAKADRANDPYELADVHAFVAECAGRGSYYAGFDSRRWTPELTALMEEAGFTIEVTGFGSTRVHWAAKEASRA